MKEAGAQTRIAQLVVEGFDESYARFRDLAAHAKERFDDADWPAVQDAVLERLRAGDEHVERTAAQVCAEVGPFCLDVAVWRRAKLETTVLLVHHKRPELAETFFNSVARRTLGRPSVADDFMFVQATISTEYIPADEPTYRSYYPEGRLEPTFAQILRDYGWHRPFADLERDVEHVIRTLEPHVGPPQPNLQVRALGSAFYRNKAAYVVGKIVNGDDELPFAIAVVHDADGRLALDAVLYDSAGIDVLFSLSRAYFMVDIDRKSVV